MTIRMIAKIYLICFVTASLLWSADYMRKKFLQLLKRRRMEKDER